MSSPIFDTRVQDLKYRVLKEVAKAMFNDTLLEEYDDIPRRIVPGPKPTMRCCIYKERAIVSKRVKLAIGGDKNNPNIVEVIKIACEECPMGGYEVTNRCRGCIAHRCEKACKKNAIRFDERTHAAFINKDQCVNCGMCAKACQYNAIQNYQRPCEQACSVKAISMDEFNFAFINEEKCIQCGHCVSQCPFGAIMDKSYITHVIKLLKASENNTKYPVYAVIAPSIATQFESRGSVGQIVSALKELGFAKVIEAALGADMVALNETKELIEKGFLTSSCCPAFVNFVKKKYPQLIDHVSHSLSPMATISQWVKQREPEAHIVFIGPCIAKKGEIMQDNVKNIVDYVLTFEELQALIDAKEIDVGSLKESELDEASYFGRIFGRCGGLVEAVKEGIKELNATEFTLKPFSADGVDNCKLALNKAIRDNREFNFLEGMACIGGCIGGPACLNHELKDRAMMEKYAKESNKESIEEAIEELN